MPQLNRISIYQVPLSEHCLSAAKWINMPFESARSFGFNMSDGTYECVCECVLEGESATCEMLMLALENADSVFPGFSGRPIATSDVIALNGDWFYVDPHGFVLFDAEEYGQES